ncbi:Alpha-pyrone synthesis polyketide synthase-like Pks11 [Enhygromyxa salina]|uniref:Alpha-pyrone synthesis polyketide synthase-like Pks11 n=1 Tax=Enhygromyxa salina TaxID=215803 RepID=A0A2S9XJ03_9BACT|nr:type III polyketide synthase [Enhygromyxa salina]PRP92855.1 Alpha-pyrone synthesis polyketide synthase-like Pks11 [Enhygromyxa salina]
MSTHHSSVSRPVVAYPEHRLSLAGMLTLARELYGHARHFRAIERMISNTQIAERRFALPLEQIGKQAGLAERTRLYMEHARPLARGVIEDALNEAALMPADIDLIITSSCTSFVMPSLDAYLINDLGFPPTTRRLPIAQLGCVAGVSALLMANDYCRAYPEARVLVVAVELSSLCFFPEHDDLTSAVCASIFGDGAMACVVSGAAHDGSGLRLGEGMSYTMPDSEHYIRYEVGDGGFHLTLDRGVMHSIPKIAPTIQDFVRSRGVEALDFVVAHTGGRRILDGIVSSLGIDERLVGQSRASLREVGNTASVSVFDVLRRAFDNERPELVERPNHGIVVAFGPGFTMALLEATWA